MIEIVEHSAPTYSISGLTQLQLLKIIELLFCVVPSDEDMEDVKSALLRSMPKAGLRQIIPQLPLHARDHVDIGRAENIILEPYFEFDYA